MHTSPKTAEIIAFPQSQELAEYLNRATLKRDRLHTEFYNRVQNIPDIKLHGMVLPELAITSPFFAHHQLSNRPGYCRIATNYPTDSVEGVHEIKFVGMGDMDQFTIEIHEPRVTHKPTSSFELRRLAQKRLKALHTFRSLSKAEPLAPVILEILSDLSTTKTLLDRAVFISFRAIIAGSSIKNPPRAPSLELFLDQDQVVACFDHYPLPSGKRVYNSLTDHSFAGIESAFYH